MADDLTLTGCSIEFRTHNDNKDHDTVLDVTLKNKANLFLSQDIASGQNLGGDQEFPDPSTKDFNLTLASNNIKMSDLTQPFTNIHITPNGHDRWIFDFTVNLIFADASGGRKTFSSTTNGVILDQDNRDFNGVFGS